MAFIFPNGMGWTTIQPGRPIQQYLVFPGPGQVAPNGARMAPTSQDYQAPQSHPALPNDGGFTQGWHDFGLDADDAD